MGNADVVFLTPRETDAVTATVDWVRKLEAEAGRRSPLRVFADLVVFLDRTEQEARTRLRRLDALAGAETTSDALIFTGTPEGLADLLADWHGLGVEGFRLRPGVSRHDLPAITRGVAPALRERGLFRGGYEATTLRERLGLPRPAVGAGIP
ncbi:Luciferase-like, subgroup (fragment) [Frankia canadensis]|uniref:Luciferase-like, subgroup n=1 Tax=Frankia canadensis TaxID=1836972 RepID=A0A2I2KRN3_9ACTN